MIEMSPSLLATAATLDYSIIRMRHILTCLGCQAMARMSSNDFQKVITSSASMSIKLRSSLNNSTD